MTPGSGPITTLTPKDVTNRCAIEQMTWYWKQAGMMVKYNELKADGLSPLALTWDSTGKSSGSKIYSVCESAQTFFDLLIKHPVNKRWGYELIPENGPVRGYMDIEWFGEADTAHVKIEPMMKDLRKKLVEHFKVEPAIYVCCGSRPDKKGYKNSYHVTVENIVFQNNHDGQMLHFFDMQDKDIWYYTNPTGDFCPVFDNSVYSRNRCIRLPLCTKKGSTVPFIRISEDPFEDKFGVEIGEEDVDELLPFVLTNPPEDGDHFKVNVVVPPPKKKFTVKKQRTVPSDPLAITQLSSSSDLQLPFPRDILEKTLRDHGDTVSEIAKVEWKPDDDVWQIQCNQKKRQRKCICTANKFHHSNNCLLFVKLGTSPNTFDVDFHCTSEECKTKANVNLGTVSLENYTWAISKKETTRDEMIQEVNSQDKMDQDEMDQDEEEEDVFATRGEDWNRGIDLSDPSQNQYDQVMTRIEKCNFKIGYPSGYGEIDQVTYDDGLEELNIQLDQIITRSRAQILDYLSNVPYYEGTDRDAEEKKFVNVWLHDKYMRCAQKLTYDFTLKQGFIRSNKKILYNEWPGFIAERIPEVKRKKEKDPEREKIELEKEKTIREEHFKPFFDHIKDVFCTGDEEEREYNAQFIVKWFAHIIQKPTVRTDLVLVLFGPEGCGKNALLDPLRECILGTYCAEQTGDAEAEVFAKHATVTENKLLVQIDELTRLKGTMDRFKNMITAKKTKVERKFTPITQVKNHVNYIITTNNRDAIKMGPGEGRRFALFRCNDTYIGQTDYFKSLIAHLRTPAVAKSIFKCLKEYDISDISNFQIQKPKTAFLKEIMNENIQLVPRYLSALANVSIERTMYTTEMFQGCKMFALNYGYEFSLHSNTFGVKVSEALDGNFKDRESDRRFYKIDPPKWIEILTKKNLYDRDAELPLPAAV